MDVWLWLIVVLAIAYTFLIIVYRYGWTQTLLFDSEAIPLSGKTKVSILIPARNEEGNILHCLDAVSAQSYPAHLLEIIVINDHSTDDTAGVVTRYAVGNVRLINLADHLPENAKLNAYKKKAIETAIGLCSGDLILTTDADCVMDRDWVSTVVKYYESGNIKFIAAPVAFHKEDTFLKVFQSLDFMTMQGITGATAFLKCGTMCNGANLAYERQAFLDVGGFQGIDCIASGDDMLLMYKMYKAFPCGIGFLRHPDAVVRTLPMDSWRSFMHQRIRWASKADKYDDKRLTAVLALVYIWNAALLVFFFVCFFYPSLWIIWLLLIVYKTVVELFLLYPVARFFGKARLLWLFFPSQFLHIPYIVISGWLGKFGSYQWKNRQVK